MIESYYKCALVFVLIFIGVPANCLLLFVFGRKSVIKDSTVISLLALAVADLIPCLVTSPFEAVILLLNLNSNSTSTPCLLALGEQQYCNMYISVFTATELFSVLLNNLLAINCCYATWRSKGKLSRLCTNFRRVIVALIVVFFIFSVVIGVLTGVTQSIEEKFLETIPGRIISFIIGGSIGCTLITILTMNTLTVSNIIKQQNQSRKFARELEMKQLHLAMDQENVSEMIQPEGQKSLAKKSKDIHSKTQIQVIKRLLITTFIFFFSNITSLLLVQRYTYGHSQSMNGLENENFTALIFVVVFRELWRYNHIVNAFLYGFMSTKFKRECSKMKTRKDIPEYSNETRLDKQKKYASKMARHTHNDDNLGTSNPYGADDICNDPMQLSTFDEHTIASNEGEAETTLNEAVLPDLSTNLGLHSLPSISSHSEGVANTTCIHVITVDVHAVQ